MNEGLGALGFFTMVGWIVYVLATTRQQRDRARAFASVYERLFERMGSARELSDFIQTPAGVNLLGSLSRERYAARETIVSSVRTGILAASIGFALRYTAAALPMQDPLPLIVVGTVCLALAGGFVVSGLVSYWLASTMGIVENTGRPIQPAAGSTSLNN